MINNPYPKDKRGHRIQARVDPHDYFFLRTKFAYGCPGITDKIVATLFKRLIDELKRIDSITPLEPAVFTTDVGYVVLDQVFECLAFVERRAVGGTDSGGDPTTQHVDGGTVGVRETVRGASKQRTKSKGGVKRRRTKEEERPVGE